MNLALIQEQLRDQKLDGWLLFDHHRRDPIAYRILGLDPKQHITRRWYYMIPAQGEPLGLVHRIEAGMLGDAPGARLRYSSWVEQVDGLRTLIGARRKIAMQFSPLCAIPYISLVDGGTIDLIRSLGAEVVASAELVQFFEARLDQNGLDSHLQAGRLVDRIRAEAFQLIADRVRNNGEIGEFEVAQFIRTRFAQDGLITESGPIVGVNQNAGNPHYEPDREHNQSIRKDNFVLLDMWAKLDRADAVYYDITWTGYGGRQIPDQIQNVFQTITSARDAAIETVVSAMSNKHDLRGFQVDDAARSVISKAGFGPSFTHRTGHSIGLEIHGNGANMDNLETHDDRRIIPWTCFSIEPGVYLENFGVRSEVNMFVLDESATVTGEIQKQLVILD